MKYHPVELANLSVVPIREGDILFLRLKNVSTTDAEELREFLDIEEERLGVKISFLCYDEGQDIELSVFRRACDSESLWSRLKALFSEDTDEELR